MDSVEVDGVLVRFDAETRILSMSFPGTSSPSEEAARAIVEALGRWVGDAPEEPFRLLVDCRGLTGSSPGWRSVFAAYFKQPPIHRQVRLAWFHMNAVLRVIVLMFLKATQTKGRGFATEEEARAWIAREEVAQ